MQLLTVWIFQSYDVVKTPQQRHFNRMSYFDSKILQHCISITDYLLIVILSLKSSSQSMDLFESESKFSFECEC